MYIFTFIHFSCDDNNLFSLCKQRILVLQRNSKLFCLLSLCANRDFTLYKEF